MSGEFIFYRGDWKYSAALIRSGLACMTVAPFGTDCLSGRQQV
jgi:hypothetical protein